MKKMNILQFICPTGLHGAEMWILALARNLDPEKINCHLAVTLESEDQNIEVYNRFLKLGLPGHKLEMQGRFDPKGLRKLCKLIQRENIDLIHTHGYKSDILGLIAAKITGIKTVSTPHGFENVNDFKLRMFIRLGCLMLRFFDKVAPLSEELESDMCRIGVSPEKVQMIMNGVDLDEAEAERNSQEPPLFDDPGEKRISYVGQMIYRKNIDDMIRAFDLLYKDHKNIRLLLIGDGPGRAELEEKAKASDAASKIEFLGYRTDRLKLVKESALFAMTSSLEGIPRCMMEAMAMGTPVAAYNIPGVDKLILHGETGLMAEFGQVEALKAQWEKLLFDEDFSAQMAEAGRQHVLEKFSGARMAVEYERLYQSLMV
ncbi:MAG: glycosyltransferase [Desulfobacteraceae bacterium 4572_88]|nr:MAG: glycosyltransferase [Desulfobacteraceae bacterium 4572_88]